MNRGFAVAANVKSDVIAAAAREADRAGYTSFWVNHPGPFDGLASLAAAAKESQRIALGIGVMSVFVMGLNHLVWRRLYRLAEDRMHF